MDYCTLWFEGWWAHCCMAHDAAYETQALRDLADAELFRCVASSDPALAVASVIVAGIMWFGVRAFGWPLYNRASKEKA